MDPATSRHLKRDYKIEAVRAVLKGKKPVQDVAEEFGIPLELLSRFVQEFKKDPEGAFGDGALGAKDREIADLRLRIEALEAENAFLKKSLAYLGKPR